MRRLILIAALAVAAPAQATTVFGLTFGQPLALPECVRNPTLPQSYAIEQPSLCQMHAEWHGPAGLTESEVAFPRASAPSMVSSLTIEVFSTGGLVGGARFQTAGIDDQDAVLSGLTAKYGKPDHLDRPIVRNRVGGTFEAINATWSKPDLFVEFQSAPVRIDFGSVTIETPTVKALWDARDKTRADQRTPL